MHYPFNQISSVAVSAIFVENIILVMMIASKNFFSVLKKPRICLTFGLTVTVFATIASVLSWLINHFVLVRFHLTFLSPFAFALTVVLLEFLLEFALIKIAPVARDRFGKLIPATSINLAVLGTVFVNIQVFPKGVYSTAFFGFCSGIGFLLALFILSAAMSRAEYSTPPSAFRGLPIALVTASIVSLAFLGFSGIQIPF